MLFLTVSIFIIFFCIIYYYSYFIHAIFAVYSLFYLLKCPSSTLYGKWGLYLSPSSPILGLSYLSLSLFLPRARSAFW